MRSLGKVHGALVHLFAGLIVIQFFLAGLGAFTTVHDKKFDDNNFGAHGMLGTLLVLVALVMTAIALIRRSSPAVTKLSAALLGLMIVQFVLGVSGAGTSPVLGGLHATNALAIAAVAVLLIKVSRSTHGAPAASSA